MLIFPNFDPSQYILNGGYIDTNGVNVGEQIELWNDSPYGLLMTFADNSQDIVPAFWHKDIIVEHVPMGRVKWTIYYILANATQYAISNVYGTILEKQERRASNSGPINRGIIITNPGGVPVTGTTSSSTFINKAGSQGTVVEELSSATNANDTSWVTNDGLRIMGVTIAGLIVQWLKVNNVDPIVQLGASSHLVEVLGNLTVDGVLTGNLTGTASHVPATGVTAGNLPLGVILTSNIQSSQVVGTVNAGTVGAAGVQSGTFGAGVIEPANQIGSGNLASNVMVTSNIPPSQINAGNLPSGVILTSNISASQVTGGIPASSVPASGVTGGTLGTGVFLSSKAPTATVADSANSILAANVAAGSLPSGVMLTSQAASALYANSTNYLNSGTNNAGELGKNGAKDMLDASANGFMYVKAPVDGSNNGAVILQAQGTGIVSMQNNGPTSPVTVLYTAGNNGVYMPLGKIGKTNSGDWVDFSGNGTYFKNTSKASWVFQAPPGTNLWSRTQESKGSITVVYGTPQTVNHSLGVTPDFVSITPMDGSSNGSSTWNVYSLNATSFTIMVGASGTHTFLWKAERW